MARKGQQLNRYTQTELSLILMALRGRRFALSHHETAALNSAIKKTEQRLWRETERAK